jgi:hypothetical protein
MSTLENCSFPSPTFGQNKLECFSWKKFPVPYNICRKSQEPTVGKGLPLEFKFANIRQGEKGLPGKYTLAYYSFPSASKTKTFYYVDAVSSFQVSFSSAEKTGFMISGETGRDGCQYGRVHRQNRLFADEIHRGKRKFNSLIQSLLANLPVSLLTFGQLTYKPSHFLANLLISLLTFSRFP